MKKSLTIFAYVAPFLVTACVLCVPLEVSAIGEFKSLTGIDGSSSSFGPLADVFKSGGTPGGGLISFTNSLFTTAISIGALLAVLMIAYGGWQLMVSDIADKRREANERIQNAIIGLLMLLATVLVLRTVNPDIVALRLFQGTAQVTSGSNTTNGNNTSQSSGLPTPVSSPYGYCAQTADLSGYYCYTGSEGQSKCVNAHGNFACGIYLLDKNQTYSFTWSPGGTCSEGSDSVAPGYCNAGISGGVCCATLTSTPSGESGGGGF